MKKLLLIGFCVALTSIMSAQTIDKKWNVGLHGGFSEYNGDLGNGFYKMDLPLFPVGGLSVTRYLTGNFDLNLLATKGVIGYNPAPVKFRGGLTTATLNARFNVIGPQYAVRPYLFLGGGVALFDKDLTISEKKVDFITPSFGGGINFRLGPSVMLNLNEAFLYSNADDRDGATGNENDMYLLHTVGLTYSFGNKNDADKDGVSDYKDKCPDTPERVAVDNNGCPLDKDGDGIADYQDECPDVAGLVEFNGCPDKDGDGIADKNDDCPDVKGLVPLKGCPDTDGDGIADKDDRCPDVAGPRELKGCPDADKDGVADIDDKCPNTKAGYTVDATGCTMDNDNDGLVNEEDDCPDLAGILALKGCPDTDGDGVSDKYDRCPTVKGTIENKGCPEMTVEEVKKITNIASRIFFETNSDVLKVASLSQLDELTEILKKYDQANLLIEGHADSQGEDDFNLNLSQKRTDSVKAYLMGKGIMESRLTAIGYGETRPVADNNTAEGRAKNRRVALKTSY